MNHPKVLIEEWLPAQALGIECMREQNNPVAKPPHTYFHVWWARRPLTVSRAAVLASLLPADFDRRTFERLVGFGIPSQVLIDIQKRMDMGEQVEGGYNSKRAFSNIFNPVDIGEAAHSMKKLWNDQIKVLDPMAGGGSIPLESARLGLNTLANEYNPVACSILEASLGYPLEFGERLVDLTEKWGQIWGNRIADRITNFYPKERNYSLVHAYIFSRTVPCPDTGHPTPLIPDWHLLKPKLGLRLVANPIKVDSHTGQWQVELREIGKQAGQLPTAPEPTYKRGQGRSLYTHTPIPGDYIKAQAQQGKMGYYLYAVATKATKLEFRPPNATDLQALQQAEEELARLRPDWEARNIIPTEEIELGDKTRELLNVGIKKWAGLFAPRQLLALGVLVEELGRLRPEILAAEGEEVGYAVEHLLAFAINKLANYNSFLSSWISARRVVRSVFDRHDFSFKATFTEVALCEPSRGLDWAIKNVIKSFSDLSKLPRTTNSKPITITQGSATALYDLDDETITAVVVDPPYADNVQYGELADFFYVWLKRTQGHRRPEWFLSELCDTSQEAVVNIARNREEDQRAASARAEANEFYQQMMTDVFKECHRVLREDGVLTVMFTHKKQEAWSALFESLIEAGFMMTATWPVQTESQHSLHQAKKNAAQSTVLLTARKRDPQAELGIYDEALLYEVRKIAQDKAAQLAGEGLNAVDQMVGAFGPAMQVFTQYPEVYTDTGEKVEVSQAIQDVADAVAEWRVNQLSERSLEGLDAASRFVLLCWDVLGASQFRFNEAMLLGRSVGMDVNGLIEAGLVEKSGENITVLSASGRRRERQLRTEAEQLEFFEQERGRRRLGQRKIHPNDEYFASAIDMCHALALRHAEAGGGQAGVGAARGLALEQNWSTDSPCAQMMEAILKAAPQAVRFEDQPTAKLYPEFRAWHAMLEPLFNIQAEEWKEELPPQLDLEGFE